ncbi:peptidoglycan DD-metalloendopeptidase family protein [Peribacillus sp. SCS-37]|uniref:peptidoglycan DD-metalloendopeptidase family protein n=1 Tax=Paraperibacillus esterisolvens TaxID=3115296 RepID=UPI0039069A34
MNRAKSFNKYTEHLIQKVLIFTVILIMGTFHSAAAFGPLLPTIYKVYYKDTYLGKVSDKKNIKDAVKERVEAAESEYPGYSFSMKKDIKIKSETVLFPKTDDKKVVKKVDELPLEAKSYALEVDGEKVAYLPEKKEAEETIDELKTQYLSKAEKKKVEAAKSAELPQLYIRLSKNVSISREKVDPSKIVEPKEALHALNEGKTEQKEYKAMAGEKPEVIATKHHMQLEELTELNPELKDSKKIKDNGVLKVLNRVPYVDVIIQKEVSETKEIPNIRKVVKSSGLLKGMTEVKQKGKKGEERIHSLVLLENGVQIEKKIETVEEIKKPVPTIIEKGTKVLPSVGSGKFTWPAVDGIITSKMGARWGRMHKGIDIAGPSNRTIKASDNGVVKFAGMSSGYGNKVIIDHQNGYETLYGHLASISIKEGDVVAAGTKIGVMGSTGDSTGVHLHFEVRKNGILKNPLNYINN